MRCVPVQGPPSAPVKPAEHWHDVAASAPVVDDVPLLAAHAVQATLPELLLYVSGAHAAQLLASAPP